MSRSWIALVVLAAAATLWPGSASATDPGRVGKIAFADGWKIRMANSDGSGFTGFDPPSGYSDRAPTWLPTGTKIAFFRTPRTVNGVPQLLVANSDGSNPTILLPDASDIAQPAWSPDGGKIAFVSSRSGIPQVYVMNSDGTGQTQITNEPLRASGPTWSPDGSRIAFSSFSATRESNIYGIDPTGSNRRLIADTPYANYTLDWSPDGRKIAFDAYRFANYSGDFNIWTVNVDGTGITRLTNSGSWESEWGGDYAYWDMSKPTWSPDGRRIALEDSYRSCCTTVESYAIVTVAAEGGPRSDVIRDPSPEESYANTTYSHPDWQSIPINSYPRPLGAKAVETSLVPAYRACDPDAADRAHGPPLAHPSCAPPAPASSHLTVGVPDANGRPINSHGSVKLNALSEVPLNPNNGDQADVAYVIELQDVRRAADLADYTGELQARIAVRITDRNNTPSPVPNGAATVSDASLSFDAPCTATPQGDVGASCVVSTTADALVPGIVTEGRRAVWELGQVRVFDGGPDGDAQTGPNTLFAVQGVFVP